MSAATVPSVPIASVNPSTGEVLRRFEPLSWEQIDPKLEMASQAFQKYRCTSFSERARCLSRAAEILESEADSFARLLTLEMGKTLASARAEALKSALGCRYYAENGEGLLADEFVPTQAQQSYIHCQPLGPIVGIMPWNFPFWQVFRYAAPALMAGNVCLLKHAPSVPQCALAIEDVFRRAGFSEGVFQVLLVTTDEVERIIDDPLVAAVTLTGSVRAGSQVALEAGRRIKKTVLELGGSDPFIVMPSADLDRTVKTAVAARTINNGQSCIAAKRFIVAEPVAHEFERRFVEGMKALRVGDPMLPSTDVGPLASEPILKNLERQVRELVASGARVLTGGHRLPGPGYFYAPTVLTDIDRNSPVFYEELFGPVAMLFVVPDADAAIRLANDSPFGLGASAWTNDPAEQARFIDELQAGMVFINEMVASDPRLPFGGIKQSGYGRELGAYGIREFVNIKTIWVNAQPGAEAKRTE